jgi:hypothetical protein
MKKNEELICFLVGKFRHEIAGMVARFEPQEKIEEFIKEKYNEWNSGKFKQEFYQLRGNYDK